MKQSVVLFFCLLHCTFIFTQATTQQIDSLKALIPQKADTALVHLYEELERIYFQYRMSNDSVEKYFNLSMELAEKIDYEEVSAEFFYRKSLLLYRKGRYEKAIESVKKYIAEQEEAADLENVVKGKSTLGSFYYKQNKYEEAVNILLETIELSEGIDDKTELYLIYNRLASINQDMGELDQSTKYYELARQHLQYIPEVYMPTSEITLLYNIAINFHNKNELDSAGHYANLVLEKAHKINNQSGINKARTIQMHIALSEKQYEQVLQFANQLLGAYEKNTSTDLEWHLDAFRGKAIALTHLGRYEEALAVSQTMEALASSCELFICREKVIWVKYLINRESGNYEQALNFIEQHFEVTDSMGNEEKEKYIQGLQEKYETVQKEKAIVELNQQNQEQVFRLQRRNYLMAGISLLCVLVILSIYWFSQQKIAKEAQQKIEAEQRLLRVQMNPHFIFNSLANIQSFLLEEKDNEKGVQYLSQLATLMRQVLEHSREQYINVEDEVQTLENYLSLQKVRHQERFNYQIEVDQNIEGWETLIPPLMTQPFVENAIQHSQIQQLEDGNIKVLFQKREDSIIVKIEDNGVGRKNALKLQAENAHKSLSSIITEERIQLLNKITKQRFSFQVKDLPQRGTQVVLEFPLMLNAM
ncbi:MAG: histidine kinase [Bacteroidota bacterium]